MIFLIKAPLTTDHTKPLSLVKETSNKFSLVFKGRAVALLEETPAADYYIAWPIFGENWAGATVKMSYVRAITGEEVDAMDDPERFAGHKLSWWETFKRILGIS